MNVLEKILDEIENAEKEYVHGHNALYALAAAGMAIEISDIIHSHMEEISDDDWIPTSERLPEDGRRVLVWYEYFRYGDYNCMYQTHGIGFQYKGHWSGDVSGTNARCIAWQPLPEPYKPREG